MIREPTAKARAEHAPRPLLFDVEDYHRLYELGCLDKYGRVELINGVIYQKWPNPNPDTPEVIPGPRPIRFSPDDYHNLLEVGFLNEDDRVELINGEIIVMAPTSSVHRHAVLKLSRKLWQHFDDKAVVMVQSSLKFSNSEPEPDLALLKMPEASYKTKDPNGEDVLLLIEVSNTTLGYDRTYKLELYAKHNISEVWIVNLRDKQLEIYRDPENGKYTTQLTKTESERAAPLAFPDIQIDWSL